MACRVTHLLVALCFSLGLAPAASAQPLHTEGGHFRDEAGAVVMLRGLNVAGDSKVPPFRPVDDPALFDRFPEWGVNVARLLFTWEAFEGEREVYDESYFEYYRGLVDALAARGVWTIVDFHQDAFSRFSTDGCGEGMPRWAVTPDVMLHEPDNGPDCAGWGLKFILDGDTHKTWDAFYADTHGVRTRYLALMDVVSERLGSHPAVIGYDIINEPWGDEVTQIAPLQADAERLIRANDPDSLIFVSPQALTSAGQETKLPKPAFDNYAYSPHYYDGAVIQLHRWLGGSLKDPVERMYNQARAWGVPLFVGEFGAPGDGVNVEPYMSEFYLQLDQRFISAAQWSWVAHWDEVKKDGWNTEDFSIVEGDELRQTYWVRPYPARIAGTPGTFAVTRGAAAAVELSWTHDPTLGATRLFAPFLPLFAAQAFVETASNVGCSYEADRRHLRCTAPSAGDKRIRVRACAPGEACTPLAEPEQPERDAGAGDGDGDGDGGMVMEENPATGADASVGPPPTVMPGGGCALGAGRPAHWAWLLLLGATWLGVRRSRYNSAHE
jgi:endoglycosylceramidase